MEQPIPADALERAQAAVRAFREQVSPILENLPEAPGSAIQFRLPEEP